MPPKKAAKKAARQDPSNHRKQHEDAKDLRRAYEHLGRVEILRLMRSGPCEEVVRLINLAQDEVANGISKSAADLLRAAEHLSFAALLEQPGSRAQVYGALMTAIGEEFDRLTNKAQEHWEPEGVHPVIANIYRDSLAKAAEARERGALRRALELARGAEALAHVKPLRRKQSPKRVAARSNVRELAAS